MRSVPFRRDWLALASRENQHPLLGPTRMVVKSMRVRTRLTIFIAVATSAAALPDNASGWRFEQSGLFAGRTAGLTPTCEEDHG